MGGKVPARLLRWLINLWPPYLGAGIRVRSIAPDYREVVVEVPLRFYNRSFMGTQPGGSLFAMTDPFYMLMLTHNLDRDYLVWDKQASIDYVAAARSRVRARMCVSDQDLAQIRARTADGDKHLHLFRTEITDGEGLVVARVEKIVYVRRRRAVAERAT